MRRRVSELTSPKVFQKVVHNGFPLLTRDFSFDGAGVLMPLSVGLLLIERNAGRSGIFVFSLKSIHSLLPMTCLTSAL